MKQKIIIGLGAVIVLLSGVGVYWYQSQPSQTMQEGQAATTKQSQSKPEKIQSIETKTQDLEKRLADLKAQGDRLAQSLKQLEQTRVQIKPLQVSLTKLKNPTALPDPNDTESWNNSPTGEITPSGIPVEVLQNYSKETGIPAEKIERLMAQ